MLAAGFLSSSAAVALAVDDEVFGALGESLGDDLGVEGVAQDFWLILERLVVMQVERR